MPLKTAGVAGDFLRKNMGYGGMPSKRQGLRLIVFEGVTVQWHRSCNAEQL